MPEPGNDDTVMRRAIAEPEFRERLRTDPASAIEEVTGVSVPDDVEIVVVANTPQRFHLVLPPTELDLDAMDQAAGRFAPGSPEWVEYYQLRPPSASWLLG